MDTTFPDLLSDDLLDSFEFPPALEQDDEFANFLGFLHTDFPADPSIEAGSVAPQVQCNVPPRENVPPAPQPSLVPHQQPPQQPSTTADVPQLPVAAPQDPEAARMERIRAKNRRGQAKYREKLKVLLPSCLMSCSPEFHVEARSRPSFATCLVPMCSGRNKSWRLASVRSRKFCQTATRGTGAYVTRGQQLY